MAVFLLGYLGPLFSSRPPVPCSSAHLLDDCFSDPLPPSPAAIGFMFRIPGTRCRLLLLHFSFEPTLGFDELVGFFSPDCDFLVVIVPVASLSRCFVRDLSSGLLLQLHLVVVYSDLACRVTLWYGVVAGPAPVRWFTTTWSVDSEETFRDAAPRRGPSSPCLSVLCFCD